MAELLTEKLQQDEVLPRLDDVGVLNDGAVIGFEEMVAARGSAWTRYAYMLWGSQPVAEDLVQQALLGCHRRSSRIDAPDAYVRRAITNTFLSWRRRRVWEPAAIANEPWQDDGTTARAERDEVWRALGVLPRRQSAALVLRYYQDLPDEQIARILDCAPATVRSLISRALQQLRQHELGSRRREEHA